MQYETIRYEVHGGVAVVTLDRPARRNALDTQMRIEITHAAEAAGEGARVLVVTGANEAFCSGQDLSDGAATGDTDLEQILRDEYVPLIKAIAECPVPTIAAVQGAAAGAGANLALAADVVIAAESAVFVQAFTRIGLIPDAGGTHWLPRRVGLARAMGAALFAEPVGARQAVEWGMIWEAVPDDMFEAHWRARAGQLAEGPTQAYRGIKQALRTTFSNDLDEQLAQEGEIQGRMGRTRDFREGVLAFQEKRPARYEGR